MPTRRSRHRRLPVRRRLQHAARCDRRRRRRQLLASSPSTPRGVELLLFDRRRAIRSRIQVDRPRPRRVNRTFHFWHVYVRGLGAGLRTTPTASTGPGPGGGHRFNREQGAASTRTPGATRTTLWEPGDACGPGDNVAHVDAQRRRRRRRLRLGGRPAAQPAAERHDHLRDARPRLHARRRPRASSTRAPSPA